MKPQRLRPAAEPAAIVPSSAVPTSTFAELITIGSELLLGETVDTNAAHVARALGAAGIPLRRKVSVADDVAVIAAEVAAAAGRAPIVLTTGGLGPTQDDPTREAVARATGRALEFRPELWAQVKARFRAFGRIPPENNRQQAYVPAGAIAVENPVGTAPSFIVDLGHAVIISLPGVPREMQTLLADAVLPWLKERFGLRGARCLRVLHTAGASESAIDERIRDLESLVSPAVGLAAHAGQVDVRITGWADSAAAAAALVAPVEAEVRARLGAWIFGADEETLAGVVVAGLAARGWRLAVLEAGLGGELAGVLALAPGAAGTWVQARVLPAGLTPGALATAGAALADELGVEAVIAASLLPDPVSREILVWVQLPGAERESSGRHGGPPAHGPRRAALAALDLARGMLTGLGSSPLPAGPYS